MADTDIITLEDAQGITQAMSGVNAPTLELAVSAISQRVDALCGAVVQRTVTDELVSRSALGHLQLAHYPVVSVTEVSETTGGATTVVAASAYTIDQPFGLISRTVPVAWSNHYGDQAAPWADVVTVTYVAGRYASTDLVPAEWKFPVAEIVAELFRQNSARWQRNADASLEGDEPVGYMAIDDMIRRRFGRYVKPERATSVPVVSL